MIEGCEKIINWLASYVDKKGNDINENSIYSIYKIEPIDGEYQNIYIEIKQKESSE
ncbi:MAG: hypothetical protein J6Y77_06025 [Paludibacteraceae bacterium]|nr:hypothetical protein [Paludibacteraceae bacterium]